MSVVIRRRRAARHGKSMLTYLIRLAKLRPDLLSMLMCVSLPWNITSGRRNNLPLVQRTLFKLALDAPLAQRGPTALRAV